MWCTQTFSTITTNGTDIFLLENPNYFPFLTYDLWNGKFPAKFIHSPIDFQEIGWTKAKILDPSFVCHQKDTTIPHIGFFDFDLHDQMLIGINFWVFLLLVALWCVIFYGVWLWVEKLFRFVWWFCKKLFQK